MKKIESLLNIPFGQAFDTPKKLNRSNTTIPEQIITELEEGKFTHEMIAALAKKFPIFMYRTCITIHGAWSDISRRRIGGYKNIHQNQNGSVEIYYSAIDRDKIKQVKEKLISVNSEWRFAENSTDRVFRMEQKVNNETLPALKIKYQAIAKRVSEVGIYGYASCYLQPTLWGGVFIVLDIHPLAIPAAELNNLCLSMAGLTVSEWDAKVIEVAEARRVARAEREAESLKLQQERATEAAALKHIHDTEYLPLIAHLPEGTIHEGVIVRTRQTRHGDKPFTFEYYRLDGNGSFGNIKYSKAMSAEYVDDIDTLTFEKQKQVKAKDLKYNGRVIKPYKVAVAIKKQTAAIAHKPLVVPSEVSIEVVQYSEKAIALFGDTKAIKEQIKSIGGRFNMFLNHNGGKSPGWILPASKRDLVQSLING